MTTLRTAPSRRLGDRRVRRVSFHYPERRRGFDRREPSNPVGRRYVAFLRGYRDTGAAVAGVVVAIGILSALDLVLTQIALGRGAAELNPVMASLLGAGIMPAVLLKAAVTVFVIGVIWSLRRYRRILELSLFLLTGLALLTLYHLAGLALLT
jgi:hypothetical protein